MIAESDVYVRRDSAGAITTSSLIVDNFVYFLSNGEATVTVDIDFTCDFSYYFHMQEIWVGLLLHH